MLPRKNRIQAGRFADEPRLAPTRNRLLGALSPEELAPLKPHLHLASLPLGHALYESGDALQHAYFPVEGIVSLMYVTAAGDSAELAVVGDEGMVGMSLLMGGDTASSRAVVQAASRVYRIPARALKARFQASRPLQAVLLQFMQSIITQISLTALCNLHHSVDQQLCRWLLLCLDRVPGNRLHMTQDLISSMLGVRRQGVTEAARRLVRQGVIEYARGHITVLDRPRLERLACECYGILRKESDAGSSGKRRSI